MSEPKGKTFHPGTHKYRCRQLPRGTYVFYGLRVRKTTVDRLRRRAFKNKETLANVVRKLMDGAA